MKYSATLVFILFAAVFESAAQAASSYEHVVAPRARVIIDNDFGGDPDGLFQLAHHVLSPSVEVRGVIGSRLYESGFYGAPGAAEYACESANELLEVMGIAEQIPVYKGADSALPDKETPRASQGASAIVQEAMREDVESPLYIVCGAGLTNIASAYLMEPQIAGRIILVWIGGSEYPDLAPPPDHTEPEYNLGMDVTAAQVIFNQSDIPIWQVPRDAYRQVLVSYAELLHRVAGEGKTGAFLTKKIQDVMQKSGRALGEAYAMGDNPLVLLTALQSAWNPDPSSSVYAAKKAPFINDSGSYEANPRGREIRVYTRLDVRLMMEDFFAKLALYGG